MASKRMLAAVFAIVVVTALPAITAVTEFIVGDDLGWGLKVNYTEWAMGKNFKVGDKLAFKYASDKHDVLKIGGPGFKACDASMATETLETGNDVITLATPGKKWYICGIAGHCEAGMKLVINVAGEGMAPGMAPMAPAPASSGHIAAGLSPVFIVSAVAMFIGAFLI